MNKKVLVEYYGALNFGDDLFIKVLSDRYKDTVFLVVCKKKYARPLLAMNNVKPVEPPEYSFVQRLIRKVLSKNIFEATLKLKWLRFYEVMANRCESYINIGGSIFIDNDSINNSLYSKKMNIFSRMDKIILGANFGPERTSKYREDFTEIFRKFNDVCFRDNISREKFSQLGNVRTSDDVVFNLKTEDVKKIKDSVGISVINLENRPKLSMYQKNYDDYIVKEVRRLISDGKKVTFFSFCKHEGDEEIIKHYLKIISSDKVDSVKYDGDIENFNLKFSQMESIIATRFHATILALKNRQKLIPLSYSSKTDEMLRSIQYPYKAINIAELSKSDNVEFNPPYEFQPKNEQFKVLDKIL